MSSPRRNISQEKSTDLAKLAEQLTESQVAEFKECFSLFDKDGSGTVDTSELGIVLKSIGQQLTDEELLAMVREVDADGSGEVDFPEFCALMARQMQNMHEDSELLDMFELFDEGGTGYVSKSSLRYIVKHIAQDIEMSSYDSLMEAIPGESINFHQFKELFLEQG
mmetsp:Transcript_42448/g.51462  ORF Transcript_42448/g.51462 Transcript_42448/m.51462 type:complete len:166 (+) Transcript_42448:617-1114(+)|eukprot:CAMPEP_0197847810 /NCGR_PEP_ID=MMETSP1438-20131217/7154_1 /TAXON_ID=1461541 /ORGANISM="Pterosperma sp., Strain CCMP1384" /LENGTH=165 /DNA_ID=CAMNT_0043459839 /DNA_START=608 /DNA_END=1105 /DNA_ORIENTATION=+